MDALHARVLFQGSHVPGWMNHYEPWKDEKYGVAEVAADFHKRWTVPEVKEERPAFREALADQDQHRAKKHEKRTAEWAKAREGKAMEPKLPPR